MGLQGSRVQIPPSRLGEPVFGPARTFLPIHLTKTIEDSLRGFLVISLLASLFGCGESKGKSEGALTFSPSLGVNPNAMTKTPSGLRYQDATKGQGAEATAGRNASVHYTGWLPNGEMFDSSRERNQPFSFRLGAGEVIAGWDEGVAGMKVGGRRKLIIPPNLGYGTAGAPPDIPPGATLVFDVELLDVR
jgi:FKBP-type peptidyl-prolyl cis-trans isomerase FkpA